MDKSVSDINLKELIETETGQKFNKQNKILCPFHPDKNASFSVRFDSNANKYKFKCFGCGEHGDAIDFIMLCKDMSYIEAREYLGLPVEKSECETQTEKIEKYINWELTKYRSGQTLLGLFPFVNDKGETVYFKAKFKLPDGDKQLSYYYIDGDKVINKRNGEELPYNLYNVLHGIKNDKVIVICEGEKDANTLNNILYGSKYVATSVKNVKDLSKYANAYLYICGDTGEAGQKYINGIKEQLLDCSISFKIINLPGIKDLGDNKDVTDWLEAGHTKADLLQAFKRSLDLKNRYELQQDWKGIYKTVFKGDDNEGHKVYITNFNIMEASNIKFIEESKEGIKLVIKSQLGDIIKKTGEVTVFDDIKTFRNFLGSMDLVFKGKIDDLMDLKIWIKTYFAIQDEEVHAGTRFIYKDGNVNLVTQQGTLASDGINTKIISDGETIISTLNIKPISKEELQELMKYIFKFASPEKSYSIIGTAVNNMMVAQAIREGIKFHHLLIVGESGCGKSTILENVIAPILNYPKDDIKSIGLVTKFALTKDLSDGNYSIIFDEFKPSQFDQYKAMMISETLRNSYDRHVIDRGNKNLRSNKTFALTRPIIMAGEETYPNNEKALMERSCIVYLSKNERTQEQTAAMKWIMEHQEILKKLGRSLTEEILNLPVEEYKKMREEAASKIKTLENRTLNTAVNICTGLNIFNKLLGKLGVDEIKDYEKFVVSNIKSEILEDRGEVLSEVEQILKTYNDMIQDGRAYKSDEVIRNKDNSTCIRTSEMLNQINQYIKTIGLRKHILELGDFKKQAKKAGYISKSSGKVIKISDKSIRFDEYDTEKLKKLGLDSIVPPDVQEVEWEKGEQQVIYPQFNK